MVLDGFGSVLRKVLGSPKHRWRLRSHDSREWYMNLWVWVMNLWVWGHVLTHKNHPQKVTIIAELPEIHVPCFHRKTKKVNIDLTAPPSQPFQPVQYLSPLGWGNKTKQLQIQNKRIEKNMREKVPKSVASYGFVSTHLILFHQIGYDWISSPSSGEKTCKNWNHLVKAWNFHGKCSAID